MEQVTKQCNVCGFKCKNNVGSYIGKNAKVLFLFEAPTYQADIDNRITAGPVMELFKKYLFNAGISLDDIAITYMIHCFPGTSYKDQKYKLTNEPVKKEYYDACRHYFEDILNTVKPKLVVPVGSRPTKYFLGDAKATLDNVYHAIVESPLYHYPSFSILDIYTIYLKQQWQIYGIKSFQFIKDFIDDKPQIKFKSNTTLVKNKQQLATALDKLLKSPRTAIDIETSVTKEYKDSKFFRDKIMGIGFALNTTDAYYIPLNICDDSVPKNPKIVPYWDTATENEIKDDLKKFLSNETLKIAQNGQFDYKFLMYYLGINRINNASFDTLLASHLLDENLNGMRTLKLLSVLFTDMGGYESELYNWLRENKLDKKNMYKAPLDTLGTYCMYDTIATYKIYLILKDALEKEGLDKLFNTLTMPLQKVLMDTEFRGVQIDINHLETIRLANEKMLEDKLAVIRGKIGDPNFNVNSTQQLANLLFNTLGCKVLKYTASGAASTDKSTLAKYAKKYDVIKDIIEYKNKAKETSTFITGLKKELDSNNKVHTSYLLHGTDSGRLSSKAPNLQNISRDKNIKNLYIPEPGKVMIQCDLSQGEFNAWASYAQDFKMLTDIKNGLDIHKTVASKAWNIPFDEVSKELRTKAKRIVFGFMYGMGVPSAAKLVECSENEAQNIQNAFYGMYPKAAAWLMNIPVVAKSQGYLISVFGRKRRFTHLFNHPLSEIRSYAERLAKNFLMQSTVADICNRAMINLKPYLDSVNARIILTVHDSVIIQCDKSVAKEVSEKVMELFTIKVPNYNGIIKADIEVGYKWGDLSKTKFDEELEHCLEFPDIYYNE